MLADGREQVLFARSHGGNAITKNGPAGPYLLEFVFLRYQWRIVLIIFVEVIEFFLVPLAVHFQYLVIGHTKIVLRY